MEELTLTIPQTLVFIAISLILLLAALKSAKNTTVEIELPEVEEEPVKDGWTGNGGALLYGHNRDMY